MLHVIGYEYAMEFLERKRVVPQGRAEEKSGSVACPQGRAEEKGGSVARPQGRAEEKGGSVACPQG